MLGLDVQTFSALLRPLCPVSHCPIEDHYGPLINPVNSHELVAVAECDSGARKQRLGGIVTISRSSTFTRPPGHGDGKTWQDGRSRGSMSLRCQVHRCEPKDEITG